MTCWCDGVPYYVNFNWLLGTFEPKPKPKRQVKCKQNLKLKLNRCEKEKKMWKKDKLWSGCSLRFSFPLWLSWYLLNTRECHKLHWNARKKKSTHALILRKKKWTQQSICKMKAVASCMLQVRDTRNIQSQSHKFWFFISEHHRTSAISRKTHGNQRDRKKKQEKNETKTLKNAQTWIRVLGEIQLILFHLGKEMQTSNSIENRFYICQWNWKLNSCNDIALSALINHMK